MTSSANKEQGQRPEEQNRAAQSGDRRIPHHGIVYTGEFFEAMKQKKANSGRRTPAA